MSRRLLFRPKRLPRRVPPSRLRSMTAGGAGRRGRRRLTAFKFFLVLAGIITLLITFEMKLSPIVKQLALARVTYIAGKTINDAINKEIEEDSYINDDLIVFHKANDGRITAYTPNMKKINQLKAAIIGTVMDRMNEMDSTQLNIPLGNIINGEILSGLGPKIPIRILPMGTAEAKFASSFDSAGINQTRHRIIVEVTVHVSVILPGLRTGTDVTSQVSVAETIIVGVVPNTYTYLEDTGQTPMDIYGNFDLTGDGSN